MKEKFNDEYEGIPSYIKYDQPYFSVRVGDYRTKIEAYKFLKEIQKDYPTSFIVVDEIEFLKKEKVEDTVEETEAVSE
jgi:thymidine kinase